MAKTDLAVIKTWFETGDKPTQEQFWNTWDSFFHKDDKIGIDNLDQTLIDIINSIGAGAFIVAVNATQITVPAGLYDKIVVKDAAATNFKIGTTADGNEILDTVAVGDNGYYTLAQDISFDAETILYFTGVSETAILKIRKS